MVLSVWVLFVRWKIVLAETENLVPVFESAQRPQRPRTLAQRMPNLCQIAKLGSKWDSRFD
jgi:hypothetical protein